MFNFDYSQPVIMLDMDGVTFDFHHTLWSVLGVGHNAEAILGCTRAEIWNRVYARDPLFWDKVQPYAWIDYLYCSLAEIAPVVFCTIPEVNAASSASKVRALQQVFGDDFRDYILCPRKSLLARPNFVLVDDDPTILGEWQSLGGKTVVFPQPWNGHAEPGAAELARVVDAVRKLI